MIAMISRPVYFAFLFFLAISCHTPDDGGAYEGSYVGAIQFAGVPVGVWTGTVDTEGGFTLSLLADGSLMNLTGAVTGKGDFELQEVEGSGTANGTIDRKESVSGSFYIYDTFELSGFSDQDQSNYTGTWYQNAEGSYYKLVLTRNTFSLDGDSDHDGSYETTGIESGTFTRNGNDVSVSPNAGTESGKYLIMDDKLVVAIVGLSTMVFTKEDENPNAH